MTVICFSKNFLIGIFIDHMVFFFPFLFGILIFCFYLFFFCVFFLFCFVLFLYFISLVSFVGWQILLLPLFSSYVSFLLLVAYSLIYYFCLKSPIIDASVAACVDREGGRESSTIVIYPFSGVWEERIFLIYLFFLCIFFGFEEREFGPPFVSSFIKNLIFCEHHSQLIIANCCILSCLLYLYNNIKFYFPWQVYALMSFLSLILRDSSIYFNSIREV